MPDTPDEIDLNELMLRDPLSHTDQSISDIVTAMRDRRTRFNLGDQSAGSAKPRSAPKALKGLDADVLDTKIEL